MGFCLGSRSNSFRWLWGILEISLQWVNGQQPIDVRVMGMMVDEGGSQENNGRWIMEQEDDGEMGLWAVGVQETSKRKKKKKKKT